MSRSVAIFTDPKGNVHRVAVDAGANWKPPADWTPGVEPAPVPAPDPNPTPRELVAAAERESPAVVALLRELGVLD